YVSRNPSGTRPSVWPPLSTVLGPLNPNGVPLTVAELTHLHTRLGSPQALPATPPSKSLVPLQTYNTYRATGQYLSADGQTVQFVAIPKDNSSSLAAINAIPGLRAAVAQVVRASGASLNGVVSTNAFNYDIALTSQRDLLRILPIVAALIALLLA